MNLIIAPTLSLLLFENRALAGLENDIATTNQVILSSGTWRPSKVEAQKALAAIQKFLENPESTNESTLGEIKNIAAHTKAYRVQFKGVTRNGVHLIWCNFFPAEDDSFGDRWRSEEVGVSDGGYWFWHIEYDPKTGKCSGFSSNGYA